MQYKNISARLPGAVSNLQGQPRSEVEENEANRND